MSAKIDLEVCISTVEDGRMAALAGADRLELNTALELGGLTPSLGSLIELKQAVAIPVLVMIRPRPSGFCYRAAEFRTMQRDIDLALKQGADGIVFGLLDSQAQIDRYHCQILLQQINPFIAVFHRAFDVTPDPFEALEILIDLGVHRLLTSGQQATAIQGSRLIQQLQHQAKDRIEILPGSGIQTANVTQLLAETGCTQVHASLGELVQDASLSKISPIRYGFSVEVREDMYRSTSQQKVQEMRKILDGLSSNGHGKGG